MYRSYGEPIRQIRRGDYIVSMEALEELTPPSDTVDWPEEETREYEEKIERGEYPWYCLQVTVSRTVRREGFMDRVVHLGEAYLGCVDTWDLRSIGIRDVVREAIQDARHTLSVLNW